MKTDMMLNFLPRDVCAVLLIREIFYINRNLMYVSVLYTGTKKAYC